MEKVSIKRTREGVEIPKYESSGAAGFDLAAAEKTVIFRNRMKLIRTGLIVATPADHMLMLTPRSSLFRKKELVMANSVGIVDEDYCGELDEIMLALYNVGPHAVGIEKGERLANGIFVPITRAEFVEVNSMESESRGGFGSTGA